MGNVVEKIRAKFAALSPVMNERLGAEAESIGQGGIAIVEQATGMSRTTIRVGRDELHNGDVVNVRRRGGGRPAIEDGSPEIVSALEALVEPVTRGDQESPFRWTSKSIRKLAEELRRVQIPFYGMITSTCACVVTHG